MKKLFLIWFLFILGCGYSPINKIISKDYSITQLETNGNSQINTIIKKNFNKFKKEENSKKKFQIKLSSQLTKNTNSKNQSGINSNLSIKIEINLEIKQNEKDIKKLNFEEMLNYNSLENKFELKQYERILINNLTNKILDRIHFALSTY